MKRPHYQALADANARAEEQITQKALRALKGARMMRKRRRLEPKKRGNCYVTCEALYHLLGGRMGGWVPCTVKHEGDTHWYLESRNRLIRLDPTAQQFSTPPDYSKGRGRGFLTREPSKRARDLMQKLLWQE